MFLNVTAAPTGTLVIVEVNAHGSRAMVVAADVVAFGISKLW